VHSNFLFFLITLYIKERKSKRRKYQQNGKNRSDVDIVIMT